LRGLETILDNQGKLLEEGGGKITEGRGGRSLRLWRVVKAKHSGVSEWGEDELPYEVAEYGPVEGDADLYRFCLKKRGGAISLGKKK